MIVYKLYLFCIVSLLYTSAYAQKPVYGNLIYNYDQFPDNIRQLLPGLKSYDSITYTLSVVSKGSDCLLRDRHIDTLLLDKCGFLWETGLLILIDDIACYKQGSKVSMKNVRLVVDNKHHIREWLYP